MVKISEDRRKFFITNYLEKSKTAFSDAEFNLKNDRLLVASNRIYYAIFYSALALGYYHNFVTSSHKKLMGWFNHKIIYKDKIFEADLFSIFKNAYEKRNESDYETELNLDKEEVKKRIDKASKFTTEINNYLLKKLQQNFHNKNRGE